MIVALDKLIYIYCLTRNVPLLVNQENQSEIFAIEIDGIYATVKYVSEAEYSEENIKINISDKNGTYVGGGTFSEISINTFHKIQISINGKLRIKKDR